MHNLTILLVHLIATLARLAGPGGARSVVAESLLVKHQLLVLNRSRRRAPKLRPMDRIIAGLLTAFLSPDRLARSAIIFKPSTILNFHRALVKRKYRLLFSSKKHTKPGRKGLPSDMISLIVELKQRNPRFGYHRIADQVSLVMGIDISKDQVRRILAQHYKPDPSSNSPSWLTFFGHSKDSLWSVDLFRCESLTLRSYWVMVVMDQFTRRIIGFAVNAGPPDGPATCRMFNSIIRRHQSPTYLSSDNDPLFRYRQWEANLRILETEEVKTTPYVPLSHPFIERLIGTIRREYLDEVPFWNAEDLERKLDLYKEYYNHNRPHQGIKGAIPSQQAENSVPMAINPTNYRWKSYCRGLFTIPEPA